MFESIFTWTEFNKYWMFVPFPTHCYFIHTHLCDANMFEQKEKSYFFDIVKLKCLLSYLYSSFNFFLSVFHFFISASNDNGLYFFYFKFLLLYRNIWYIVMYQIFVSDFSPNPLYSIFFFKISSLFNSLACKRQCLLF